MMVTILCRVDVPVLSGIFLRFHGSSQPEAATLWSGQGQEVPGRAQLRHLPRGGRAGYQDGRQASSGPTIPQTSAGTFRTQHRLHPAGTHPHLRPLSLSSGCPADLHPHHPAFCPLCPPPSALCALCGLLGTGMCGSVWGRGRWAGRQLMKQ